MSWFIGAKMGFLLGEKLVRGRKKFSLPMFILYLELAFIFALVLTAGGSVVGLRVYEEESIAPATAIVEEIKESEPSFRFFIINVFRFSGYAVEDFFFLFLPLLVLVYFGFRQPFAIILASFCFASIHLLNNGFTSFGVLLFTVLNLPHAKTLWDFGLSWSVVFHITFNLLLLLISFFGI